MALMDGSNDNCKQMCARCRTAESVLDVRAERLCRECFMEYVSKKVFKRLESNKIRGGFNGPPKILLLPMSLGVSSISLLHVLDQQVRNRAQQGRHAGYNLHILFIDQSTVLEEVNARDLVENIKQRYPSHTCTTISLDDHSEYDIKFEEQLGNEQDTFQDIVSRLPSATSKLDFVDIARRRLITAFATKHGCDAILFGDSTTRLAERTLSETAKGRGVALPWLTADGASMDSITSIYPMRDLLRKELTAYASMVSPPLSHSTSVPPAQAAPAFKDTSIDGLMSQYFDSAEQNYPSIVANVVRTSGRLVPPSVPKGNQTCSVCGHPILTEAWGGDQQISTSLPLTKRSESRNEKAMCYGCTRTVLKS